MDGGRENLDALNTNLSPEKIMRKLIIFLLSAGFAAVAAGVELLDSTAWPESGPSFPGDWIAFTYGNASEVTLQPGKIARITAEQTGSGYIGKRSECELPAGTVVKVIGRYRTADLEIAKDGFVRVNVNFNERSERQMRRSIGMNLEPSDDWKPFSRELLLDVAAENCFAFFQMHKAKGTVEFTDLKVTAVTGKQGIIGQNTRIVWKEAEECMVGGSLSAHGRDIPDYYSGQGGYYLNNGKLTYRFKVEPEVDQQSLLPIERKYFIWGRIYGYRDRPRVEVLLNRKPIYSFQTENREKIVDGKSAGEYYWQRLGSFSSAGGAAELVLESPGRMFADALLFTDDSSYAPDRFEGRAESDSRLFTDLKIPVMIGPDYRTNSVSPDCVSPLTFLFVTPGNQPVIKPGTFQVRLPAGIKLHQVTSHWAGTNWKSRAAVPEFLRFRMAPEAGGKQLCRIELSYISLSVTLFLRAEASLNEPAVLEYSFEAESGSQPWEKLPLQIVSIPETTAFKTIRIGPGGQNFRGYYTDYPELFETCRRAGVNLLNPWHLYPGQYPDLWKDFSERASEYDIAIYGEYSPRLSTPPADERAEGPDGKPDRKPTLLTRPGSSWVQADLDRIAEMARYVDTIVIDDENTNMAGDRIDYRPEILAAFAGYRKERSLPPLEIPVVEMVKNQKMHPNEYAQWVDFKCEMMSRHYALYLEAARRHNPRARLIPQITSDRTPDELRRNSFWDYRKLLRHTDRISPMIYTYQGIRDSALVGDMAAMHNREAGQPVTVPTLLAEHSGFGQVLPAEKPMYKYQIWECLMERADTILFWNTSGFFNPVNLRYIAEGIRIAAPYEEFFLKGSPVEVKAPEWLRAKALRLNNRILVYAANYRNDPGKTGRITLPDGRMLEVDFTADRAGFHLVELK